MPVELDHPAVTAYLSRLEVVAAGLPPWRREELLAAIRGHLREALADTAADDEAGVRSVLDRLGTPEEIVAAEDGAAPYGPPPPSYEVVEGRPAPGVAAGSPWGAGEVLAVVALIAGTFLLPVVGPLVGLVLAWASPRWTTREKWVATALTALPLVLLIVIVGLVLIPLAGGSTSGGSVSVPVPAPAAP